jgi:hypothetical protein
MKKKMDGYGLFEEAQEQLQMPGMRETLQADRPLQLRRTLSGLQAEEQALFITLAQEAIAIAQGAPSGNGFPQEPIRNTEGRAIPGCFRVAPISTRE